MTIVKTGLENFLENHLKKFKGFRLGLLCNPSSVDRQFIHSRILIDKMYPEQLKALYSPQHGFYAEKQDNMIESADTFDPCLNIPVYSLYGETRIPTKKMLEAIDILLIDLPDVGTRVYTFSTTVSYCLEAAKKYDKKVLVLDRPNPIGGNLVEGNLVEPECSSFVGRFPVPMRHGLTMGELALLYNECFGIGCELEIIALKGWRRHMFFKDTALAWVAPSPNLPSPESAMVYPGQVIWEGTNVSEGRGTTQPFELFGAPFIDPPKILEFLGDQKFPGAALRETAFEPTANKWKGKICKGFQIHVTDPEIFRPYQTSLKLLQAVILLNKDQFRWKSTPYEYEFEKRPIDLILGDKKICNILESGRSVEVLERSWSESLKNYLGMRQNVLLYS
ncbi:MAG: DUF1343 domain-containing protein [Desulfobacterales bacterium]